MFGIALFKISDVSRGGYRASMMRQQIKNCLHGFAVWLARVTAPGEVASVLVVPRDLISTDAISSIGNEIESVQLRTTGSLSEIKIENIPILSTKNAVEKNDAEVDLHPSTISCYETKSITKDQSEHQAAGSDLDVTVVAVCNILEMLERQLQDVNKDVETSVTGVCKGFQGMAARAMAAVNAASESIGSGVKGGSDKDLIGEMQNVLTSLIDNVRSSSDFTKTVSGKLLGLESRLQAIESTIGDVEQLANQAKLVALNGQIEAARLGDAGKAFAVVAKETKTLSTHAAATSDSIRTLVSELSKEVKSTSAEIRRRTDIDLNNFSESQAKAKALLTDIDVNHKQIVKSLNTTGEISIVLRDDISKAVMSMQFQDRVSQRISHVIETLELLVDNVDPKSISHCESQAKERSDQWLAQIVKRYTMDSERNANGDGELVGTATNSSGDDFDVELF